MIMSTDTSTSQLRDQYRRTYETAFGPSGAGCPSGTYVLRGGQLVPVNQAEKLKLRKLDNKEIKSEALSIHPNQIPEFEKFYAAHGIEGVKHDPATGTAYFADRKTKLKVLKARQMRDNDEICGGRSR